MKKKKRSFKKTDAGFRAKPPRPVEAPLDIEAQLAAGMRLNKYLAHCGLGSRRQMASHIQAGLVQVNGEVVTDIGFLVHAKDEVRFQESIVKPQIAPVYVLINKPKYCLTHPQPDLDRPLASDLIKDNIKTPVSPIDQLDHHTAGLLVLTNDQALITRLSDPARPIQQFYHVVLTASFAKADITKVLAGVELDDGLIKVKTIDYIDSQTPNEVALEIRSNRPRVIQRLFQTLGYEIQRLDRTYYAGLTKKNLSRGDFRLLTQQEIIMLKHFK